MQQLKIYANKNFSSIEFFPIELQLLYINLLWIDPII